VPSLQGQFIPSKNSLFSAAKLATRRILMVLLSLETTFELRVWL
jgi:hypothetical protein